MAGFLGHSSSASFSFPSTQLTVSYCSAIANPDAIGADKSLACMEGNLEAEV